MPEQNARFVDHPPIFKLVQYTSNILLLDGIRSEETRHLDNNPNEHDLGFYDTVMNI
jgi:hypothetical protein